MGRLVVGFVVVVALVGFERVFAREVFVVAGVEVGSSFFEYVGSARVRRGYARVRALVVE